MATYQETSTDMMICPYDVTHKVKPSRYQIHIANCAKIHSDSHKTTCPFNAQHRPESGELNHHILSCECRSTVDRQLVASDNAYRGHTGVPSYNSQHIETEENWDEEITTHGYEPSIEPPTGGIRTDFAGMTQSQRRRYYAALPKDNAVEEKPEKKTPKLREPKTLSHAQRLHQYKPVQELQNIGLGRGQPVATKRIAANIFGGQQPAAPLRQPKSTPHILGFQNPSLGMGRGSNGGVKQETEEVPTPVGRGRGKKRR